MTQQYNVISLHQEKYILLQNHLTKDENKVKV